MWSLTKPGTNMRPAWLKLSPPGQNQGKCSGEHLQQNGERSSVVVSLPAWVYTREELPACERRQRMGTLILKRVGVSGKNSAESASHMEPGLSVKKILSQTQTI